MIDKIVKFIPPFLAKAYPKRGGFCSFGFWKTFINILVALFVVFFSTKSMAQDKKQVKTISLAFDKNDYSLNFNAIGSLEISTNKHNAFYCGEMSKPGLPAIPKYVLIPDNMSFLDFNINFTKKLLMKDVIVTTNPIPLSSNDSTYDGINSDIPQYEEKTYPKSCANYVGTSVMDGYTVLKFIVYPFEYDALNKNLYFHEEMTLSIDLEESFNRTATSSKGKGNNMREIVRSIVINPDEIEEIQQSRSTATSDTIEKYVVITSSSLAQSFQPLVQWKKTKGYDTEIITIEDIAANYSGASTQIKIKSCLYDQYLNHNLKYVLLGGDDTIVPVQGCYAASEDTLFTDMPTDYFYSCFNGSFDWDADEDGIIGERTDSFDMTPFIFVTRVPARSIADVEAFISKLLAYEKTPTVNGWSNNILMAGNQLTILTHPIVINDAEIKGENLYTNFIQPYWNGTRFRFYHTNTDFAGGSEYELNQYHLQDQLSNGYTFLDMITHGDVTYWRLERGSYGYYHANRLNNNRFTIITTMACNTNAFDSNSYDPCLSEAFIRNANNGIVAYFGCSRSGFYYPVSNSLGLSLEYEAHFYEDLFSSIIQDKNYGAIVAATKTAMIIPCEASVPSDPTDSLMLSDYYRWLQFGLNPIGDPEMPIFTTTPMVFNNSSITCYEDSLTVHTGVAGCTVCVMSSDDGGNSYFQVKREVEDVTFHGTPPDVSVCITKQNYIPKVILANLYIQNDTITGSQVFEANCIKVGTSVTSSKPSGPVVFDGGSIQLKANSVVFEPETTIESGAELIISKQ